MAALTVTAVRQRLATAAEALSGWDETKLTPAEFPAQQSAGVIHPFMVTAEASSPHVGGFHSDTGALVDTVLVFDWFTFKTPHDYPASMDAHTTAEQVLILGILAASKADLAIHWENTTRELDGHWIRGRTEFLCSHSLAFVTNP